MRRNRRRFTWIGALAMTLAAAPATPAAADDGAAAPSASTPAAPAPSPPSAPTTASPSAPAASTPATATASSTPAPSPSTPAPGTSATATATAPTASAPAASAKAGSTAAAAQGVIVIAIADGAGAGARALAREVYAQEALRPRIDDATARVLAGEAPPAGGPAKLAEIAEVRKATQAAQAAGTDAVTRRLLASLGADLGAATVLAVDLRGERPVARTLDVATAAFAPIELIATLELQPDGQNQVKWLNVAPLLVTLSGKGAAPPASSGTTTEPAGKSAAPGPIAPKKEESRPFWTSPWMWGGIGVVVAAGIVVFAVSQAQDDRGGLRLQGRVSP